LFALLLVAIVEMDKRRWIKKIQLEENALAA
jgi:hypothetical protein